MSGVTWGELQIGAVARARPLGGVRYRVVGEPVHDFAAALVPVVYLEEHGHIAEGERGLIPANDPAFDVEVAS